MRGAGFLVVSPDYLEGEPVQKHGYPLNPDFNIRTWVGPKRTRADELVDPWLPVMKKQFGTASPALCTHPRC